jgi:uncharacterized protein (TIGR02588 family)
VKHGTNWLEWTVLAVSAALVLGAAGVLGWEAARGEDGPPVVTVAAGEPRPMAGGWAVPVAVRNRSGATAANVVVEVQLGEGPAAPRGELQVPFLPKGSERSGWVAFAEPPGPGREPRVRVIGFGKP